MFCGKCGKELNENDRFCPACGAPVGAEEGAGTERARGSSIPNSELKEGWQETGTGFEGAAKSLGQSFKKTFRKGKEDLGNSGESTVDSSEVKSSWKEAGTDLGHAFKSFGKSFVKSTEKAAGKAADWLEK